MSPPLVRTLAAGVLVVAALAVAACGKSKSDSSSAGGVKGGPGVTAKEITLGIQTDESGVFAALGTVITQTD